MRTANDPFAQKLSWYIIASFKFLEHNSNLEIQARHTDKGKCALGFDRKKGSKVRGFPFIKLWI